VLESKCIATDRLRREGRWAEASLWRDQKRTQLRAEGKTRTEANEAAWQAMIEEFPPLPPSELPVGDHAVELLDIDPDSYDGQSGCAGDIGWVYTNLSVKSAAPNQAPSAGAWALLQWARRNSDRFFQLWLKVGPQQAEPPFEPWKPGPGSAEIDAMLASLGKGVPGDIDPAAR
jgi:hypothetical protein